MASSLLHPIRSRRNGGTLHNIESTIEEQIESLREEIAALTKIAGKQSRKSSDRLRYQAAAGYDDLVARSEDLIHELQEGYLRGAHEMRNTVRKHPLATVGAAAAFGLVLALLARR
ncbi:ElaB/YqjD/DUF883 family membrane-anchored ribosome-binding protein [Rhizobium sp. BK176]|nr:ElaB/YqjD/DUF883 family membrane-anchored ribosome-binding protein [Rhizobium sp. BK181]MBB3541118.1 ElaB/YqjD/DUF883 family membrane-anchored ribosome-binding protein [Rhizobium sp. BK399]MCS3739843.1 ElaB/YqjD/DUF883 family membrane-anchored ribosome-binding protein [Rhizobium sp. BK661]MCS4092208.1 ElaB/YqjD/DUF883 family membrane-anchored ribosome-binding protein [Rhizobium sp. BK176]